jgi:hypothetical protein
MFAIKKQEKRDADAEALKPKEEKGLKAFMEEYLELRKAGRGFKSPRRFPFFSKLFRSFGSILSER